MSKPKFDPTKPFEVVAGTAAPAAKKPPFDPSKPFEPVATPAAPLAPDKPLAEQAVGMLKDVASGTVNSVVPTSLEGVQALWQPGVGRAGMSGILEKAGGAVEDAVNASKGTGPVVELAAPMLKPSAMAENLGGEGLGIIGGILFRAAKVGLAPRVEGSQKSLTRRAIGYTKRFFKSPEDVARAEEVSEALMNATVKDPKTGKLKSVISPSTEAMVQRAEILSDKAGKQINSILRQLDAEGVKSVDLNDVANTIETRLRPRNPETGAILTGGKYDALNSHVDEIVKTIKAHTMQKPPTTPKVELLDAKGAPIPIPPTPKMPDPVSFGSAQELKQTFKGEAKFSMHSDNARTLKYQQAYGILREAIDDSVANAEKVLGPRGTGILKEYIQSKGIYGKAEEALAAMTNKLGTELGNNIIGLRETIIAAGELAKGNVVGAAVAAGSKPVTQKSSAIAARVAGSLAKYLRTVKPSNRQEIVNTLVRIGLLSEARKYYGEFAKRGINLPREAKK